MVSEKFEFAVVVPTWVFVLFNSGSNNYTFVPLLPSFVLSYVENFCLTLT